MQEQTKIFLIPLIVILLAILTLFLIGWVDTKMGPKMSKEQSFIIGTTTPSIMIRGPELQPSSTIPDGKK